MTTQCKILNCYELSSCLWLYMTSICVFLTERASAKCRRALCSILSMFNFIQFCSIDRLNMG